MGGEALSRGQWGPHVWDILLCPQGVHALKCQLGDQLRTELDVVPAVDLGGVLEEMRCPYEALEVELQAQLTLVSSFVGMEDSAGLPLPMGNSQVRYMRHLDTDQGPSFNLIPHLCKNTLVDGDARTFMW